jgi:dihydroorotate dehydrogenase electron transfer subunit
MRARPTAPAQAIRAEASILENRPLSATPSATALGTRGATGPADRGSEHTESGDPSRGAGWLLRLAVPDWPGSEPGQFLMLSPGAVSEVRRDDPLLPRPMAVYRDDGSVDVLYKIEGRGTSLLAQAVVGDRVRVVGPLGQPFPMPEPGSRVVIVGGGTGIASLYGLVRGSAGADVTVILGARTPGELMAREDFEALDIDLVLTTEDGGAGEQGLVTAPLERALLAGGVSRVYSCGPTPMMRRCAELAAEHDVTCLVSLENNMACGFGVCLGCAAPRPDGHYALVCRDGPVFDAREIHWEGLP